MGGGHFAPAKVVNLNRRRVVNMPGFSNITNIHRILNFLVHKKYIKNLFNKINCMTSN